MLSKQICEYNTILEMNCDMCVDKSKSATCISDDYRIEGAWGQHYAIDLPHDHVTCVLYLSIIFLLEFGRDFLRIECRCL
jgi:hypothetical protein